MSTHCLTGIKLLALDIGGVLADVNKSPLQLLCQQAHLSLGEIFNADFWALQKGILSEDSFVDAMSRKLNISENRFKKAFVEMIHVRKNIDFLENISLPYIFFSTINRLHYNYFLEQINASSFAINNSIVSFKENELKPHAHFFRQLKKVMTISPDEILVVDDKASVIAAAKQFGCKAKLYDGTLASLF